MLVSLIIIGVVALMVVVWRAGARPATGNIDTPAARSVMPPTTSMQSSPASVTCGKQHASQDETYHCRDCISLRR